MRVLLLLLALVPVAGSVPPQDSPEQVTGDLESILDHLNPAAPECKTAQLQLDGLEFCNDPLKVICATRRTNHPSVTHDQVCKNIKEEVEASLPVTNAFGTIASTFGEAIKLGPRNANRKISSIAALYATALNGVYESIMKKFKAKGVTVKELEDRISQIREQLAMRVENSSRFKTRNSKDLLSATNLAKKIRTIQWVIPGQEKVKGHPDSEVLKNLISFYRTCGANGLEVQAIYQANQNRMVICPGFLISLLEKGSVEGLTFLVSHEMGHSVDPLNLPLLDSYQTFLSCLDKNYSNQMSSLSKVENDLKAKRIPTLKARLAELLKQSAPDKNEVLLVTHNIEMGEKSLGSIFWQSMNLKKIFSSEPSAIQSHAQELSADYFGIESVADLIESHTPPGSGETAQAAKRAIFAMQFGFFCDMQGVNPDRDNGTHPSFNFRVEYALKNPRIRAQLGCGSKTQGEKPWCSLSGEVR